MIILSLGKKGSGKSALLRKLTWLCLQDRRPNAFEPIFLVHDPQAQLRTPPELGAVWNTARELELHLAKRGALRPFNIIRGGDVEPICALALRIHDVTVVLDEMDRAFDGKKWLSESAKKIVHEGRHERVSLWGTFRRTANVSEDLLTQADFVFLFRHSEMSLYDLRGLEQRLGAHYVAAVQQLEQMHFVVWRDQ